MSKLSEEEKEAIEYFKEKIKNKLPLYEETYIDGELYRINILQLETKFTEEQANKMEILLNLIEKQQKELELNFIRQEIKHKYISKDKIKEKIEELVGQGDYRTAENPNGRVHFHKEPVDYQLEILKELLEMN